MNVDNGLREAGQTVLTRQERRACDPQAVRQLRLPRALPLTLAALQIIEQVTMTAGARFAAVTSKCV